MEEDLDLFTSTLEENHKNLYANISKEEFQAEVEQVRAELPGMSEGQFYYSLRRLLSLVGERSHQPGFYRFQLPSSDRPPLCGDVF